MLWYLLFLLLLMLGCPLCLNAIDFLQRSLRGKSKRRIDVSKPAVYRPQKFELFLTLVRLLALSAFSLLLIGDQDVRGWVFPPFFAVFAVVLFLHLLPKCSYLRVSSKGIEMCDYWRAHRYAWTDISRFYVEASGDSKNVVLLLASTYRPPQNERSGYGGWETEVTIPDNYGFSEEELAGHLTQWKAMVTLTELLKHENKDVRQAAAEALGEIGPAAKAVIPALTELLKDKNEWVLKAAAEALEKIKKEGKIKKDKGGRRT